MPLADRIRQPESRRFELKEALPAGKTWLKTLVAFANGAGGELCIGVDDKKRNPIGVSNPLELEEKITNTVFDSVRPRISPYIQTLHIDGKDIVSVQVLAGPGKPYYVKNEGPEAGVYIRVGSTTRRADGPSLAELKRQGLGIQFLDQMVVGSDKHNLDKKLLNEFFRKRLFIQ